MTGLYTLSWNWPEAPAMATAASRPMTCAQTMVRASTWVGFTLPGMMDEPGSLAGSEISPRPLRGPEASIRTSLPTFMRLTASCRSAPDVSTRASWAASASNLFSAVRNGSPVSFATFAATRTSNPRGAFSPVPTAVPPLASSPRWSKVRRTARRPWSSWEAYALSSIPSVTGVASMQCVRPIFATPANASALAANVSRSASTLGSAVCTRYVYTATCMLAGKVSLDDWERFTSLLGCSRRASPAPSVPPRRTCARFAMTSFIFMLVCVPEPV
mmetsp:Transcript_564/g.1512  ORF Transcript_564/g.1512 Transcript_564/m.1512 type:complete len:273 (-) Transcript_564:293-1111(-)